MQPTYRYLIATICVLSLISPGAAAGQDRVDQAREATLIAGGHTYLQFCAVCHGVDGTGRGSLAGVLLQAPSNLTQLSQRNAGTFPVDALEGMLRATRVEEASAHGSGQMPIWGEVFKSVSSSQALLRARVGNLVAYLESFQR